MTYTREPKELQVLMTMSADLWDSEGAEAVLEKFGPRIEEAAARRGVPDMSTVKAEIDRDGVIEIGTERIDVAEHNLVLVSATLMVVPNEGEIV